MESFWSDKSLIEREFFAHEYGPENGGRTDTWKGLYRQLENQMVFQDPGLELYINPQCHIRNRYRTVLPYVKNRVKLSGGGNDYINASYVSVEEVECSYIVTQGPLGSTIRHFWEMAWEHGSTGIVMLSRCEDGSEKCAQYWPKEVHGCVIAGYFMVECRERTGSDFYTVSSLEIHNLETQETRTLLHFHYNSWADFGVPQNEAAFVRFLLAVRNSGVLGPNVGPAIVHCSAGVGRSGVFTLVDVCLSFIERAGTLDGLNVNDTLLDLRMQRLGLVQTSEQLRFAYLAILNAAHTTLGLGQNTEDFKKEVEHEMVKEVEHELVGSKAPIELPMAKLVFVRPFSQDQQKPLYFASTPLAPPNSPKSLSASLPSVYSDMDSIHTLPADSTTADQKCVPTLSSFTHTETVENTATTCLAVSSSLLSITSVDSSDFLDTTETLVTGDKATGEQPEVAATKKSWFKKLKQKMFRRKKTTCD